MNPMFYFLLALTVVLAATAYPGGPAVLDTDGDIILHGSYYVLPAIFGAAGGGLTVAPRGADLCPLYVGQEESEVNRGIPVKFSNWGTIEPFILESETLNIEMDVKATICVQSTYWWITGSSDEGRRKWFVAAGPKPKSGDEDPSTSFFQIKKINDSPSGYRIVFCPSDYGCMDDVGIFVDEYGVRRLALSATPFPVVFVKATETDTSSKTMSII